jgi:hypothetical protein
MKRQYGIGLLIIDYLQLLRSTDSCRSGRTAPSRSRKSRAASNPSLRMVCPRIFSTDLNGLICKIGYNPTIA